MSANRPTRGTSTWARVSAPRVEDEIIHAARRRIIGVLLGVGLGLSYGLVSQLINRVALPGLPLFQPPWGALGNVVLNILAGAILGFLSAQPASPALGIFLGSLVAAVAIFISTLLRVGVVVGSEGAVIASLVFSVPIAWLTVPMVALLRWAADRQAEFVREGAPLLARLRTPLVLMLIMAALAAFELLPGAARNQLKDAQALVQAGLHATSSEALPAPLRGPWVRGFPPATSRAYTLEWTRYDLDRFIQLRPSSNYDQHAAVIARFTGGYTLVCLYPTARSGPNCGTY